MAVEYGPHLNPGKEDDEQVGAEDPPDRGRVVLGELIGREVRLEHGGGVDDAVDGDHGTEGTEDDQPGGQAALGEVGVILGLSLGVGCGSGVITVDGVADRRGRWPRFLITAVTGLRLLFGLYRLDLGIARRDSLIYKAAVICILGSEGHRRENTTRPSSISVRKRMKAQSETKKGASLKPSKLNNKTNDALFQPAIAYSYAAFNPRLWNT